MSTKKHIKNGTLVTPEGIFSGDVLTDGSTIAAVGEVGPESTAEVIDATGCYVLPGGVDVHTHLNLKLGDRQVSDGFYAGCVAAAWGGTTTIIDHPEAGPAGCNLHHQPEYYRGLLEKESVIDYGIHGVFQHVDEAILAEIPSLVQQGYSSAKVYMTYGNMLVPGEVQRVLEAMKNAGGLAAFHAEDDAEISRLRAEFAENGHLAPIYHAKSRPDYTEADSIKIIADLAAKTGATVYIVHLSTGKGLDVIREAKKSGVKIIAETCPQYLLLDDSCYEKTDGLKYIMAPPLREKGNGEALWAGLADGSISVVATDHCSFSYADKKKFWQGDFRKAPGGSPSVETRLPLLFSEGVLKGRLSLQRFVDLVSANPAKIMGIYPQKGVLQPGADADLIIWDPAAEKIISPESLHQLCDYGPFDGMNVKGWPRKTMLRGTIIVENDRFIGKKGSGQFLQRAPFKDETLCSSDHHGGKR